MTILGNEQCSLNNPQFSKPTEGGPETESVEGTGATEHKLFEGPYGELKAVIVVFYFYKPRLAMRDAWAPAGKGQEGTGAPKPKIIKGPHDKHSQCCQQVAGRWEGIRFLPRWLDIGNKTNWARNIACAHGKIRKV